MNKMIDPVKEIQEVILEHRHLIYVYLDEDDDDYIISEMEDVIRQNMNGYIVLKYHIEQKNILFDDLYQEIIIHGHKFIKQMRHRIDTRRYNLANNIDDDRNYEDLTGYTLKEETFGNCSCKIKDV